MKSRRKPVNDLFDVYEFNEVTASYYPEGVIKMKMKISSSSDAHRYLLSLFYAESIAHRESFMVLYLNRANMIHSYARISDGGINSTLADPRIIMQKALLTNSSGIILAHNHPSGNLRPSESDKTLTKKMKECANFFDMSLLDHIVISGLDTENYFSFADNDLI
jgi:DNA repair protein RadC